MAVIVTIPGQQTQTVTVSAGPQLTSLGADTITPDGTEQILCQQPGGSPSQVMGYIDLASMVGGDKVVLKFYAKVKADGNWRACYEETYIGVQSLPLVHIAKRPENHGLKITVRQTAGSYKSIDYEFFEES